MPQRDNTNFISEFEQKFNVKLPEDYKFFLLKYGSGGMGCFEFFGIESQKNDIEQCTVSLMTLECRRKEMPKNLVVIEHNGDYVTCIDTLKDSGNQIVTWSWVDGRSAGKAENFEMYLTEKLEDYL